MWLLVSKWLVTFEVDHHFYLKNELFAQTATFEKTFESFEYLKKQF